MLIVFSGVSAGCERAALSHGRACSNACPSASGAAAPALDLASEMKTAMTKLAGRWLWRSLATLLCWRRKRTDERRIAVLSSST